MRALAVGAALLLLSQNAPAVPPLQTRIQAYLDEWRAAAAFPGAAVGIVLADGTSFAVTTGVADRATGTPVRPDDLFMAGSTGKFFPGYQTELLHVPGTGATLAIQINTSAPRATGPRTLLRGLYDIAAMVK